MCFSSGGDSGAAQARSDQTARQVRLDAGRANIDQVFSKFDDNFYNDRAKAFSDYQTPQLNDQYQDAQKNLVFALSRRGNLNSSVAADEFGGLGRTYARGSEAIQSGATDFANQARRDVEQNRSDVLTQLSSTENADAASAEATARARALTQAPSITPLGMLFTNLTGLASDRSAANAYGSPYGVGGYGATAPSFGSKLFSGGGSSYTVRS